MSKNVNYIYPPFVMSNDINLGEVPEGRRGLNPQNSIPFGGDAA
jgi:hypothetical protein